jgi:DNA-binding transcriptional LysR family regulator
VLFNRVGRRLELTEAGTVLLPEAKVVLAQVWGAEQALADLNDLLRGRLRLWASQTIAGYWLPPFLYQFHVAHPAVILELHIGNTVQVSRAVLDGTADLGFVEGDVDEPVLAQIPVGVDRLVTVVAKSHELASVRSIEVDHLRQARWVLREKGSGTRQVFEDGLRRLGVDPAELEVVMELPSNEAVRSVVEAGAGATRHLQACRRGQACVWGAGRSAVSLPRSSLHCAAPWRPPSWADGIGPSPHDEAGARSLVGGRAPGRSIKTPYETDKINQFHKLREEG